jgi:hypothetical protein
VKKLILIIGITLFLVSCSGKGGSTSSPMDFMDTVQSTDLSAETGGLEAMGSSEQKVIEQRGDPQMRGQLKGGQTVLEYKDYQYVIDKERVVSYNLKLGQQTAKQVKIGDNEERIAEMYGQDYYKREQNMLNIKGYLDKKNDRVIEFIIDQKKVKMILVAELSSFNK